mgnify:CR=1 FL=1
MVVMRIAPLTDCADGILGAAVNGAAGAEYLDTGYRGNIDEVPAVLLLEDRQCRRDAVEHALDVDINHAVPLINLGCGQRSYGHQARIVDQDIDATEVQRWHQGMTGDVL